jgi:hypothetical protein
MKIIYFHEPYEPHLILQVYRDAGFLLSSFTIPGGSFGVWVLTAIISKAGMGFQTSKAASPGYSATSGKTYYLFDITRNTRSKIPGAETAATDLHVFHENHGFMKFIGSFCCKPSFHGGAGVPAEPPIPNHGRKPSPAASGLEHRGR